MSYKINKIFVAEILKNYTLEEAIERIAFAISNRDDIIKELKKTSVDMWEDRMGGQFTQQEIADANKGW